MATKKYFYIMMMILSGIATIAWFVKGDLGFTLLDTFLTLWWGTKFLEENYK